METNHSESKAKSSVGRSHYCAGSSFDLKSHSVPLRLGCLISISLHQFGLTAAAYTGNDLDIRGSHKVNQSLHVFRSFNILHITTSDIVIFFKFRTCILSLPATVLTVNVSSHSRSSALFNEYVGCVTEYLSLFQPSVWTWKMIQKDVYSPRDAENGTGISVR